MLKWQKNGNFCNFYKKTFVINYIYGSCKITNFVIFEKLVCNCALGADYKIEQVCNFCNLLYYLKTCLSFYSKKLQNKIKFVIGL
jgi:hypothetical protein